MPLRRRRQSLPAGQIKVTVRLTFPDGADAWNQATCLAEDAPIYAARLAKALHKSWVESYTDTTDWDALLRELDQEDNGQ
jgi:hypothetical protein